jgi:hypothetical protein
MFGQFKICVLIQLFYFFCPQSAHCAPHIANISGSVSRLHPEALLPASVDMVVPLPLGDRHLVDGHLVERHLVDKV